MQDVTYWRSPQTIRDRCRLVAQRCQAGECREWTWNLTQVDAVATAVLEVMGRDYPDGNIPFHSRWRHLPNAHIQTGDALEDLRLKLEGVIVSVLLDAGAGSQWQFRDRQGRVWQRSEGLAQASWQAFLGGAFAGDKQSLRVDSQGLLGFTEEELAHWFQVSADNPLVGVGGRVGLLQRLGQVIAHSPYFPGSRLGGLGDYVLGLAQENSLSAVEVLQVVLTSLAPIWPGRIWLGQDNLGDTWTYPDLKGNGDPGWIPFHKLSQWLTYSLLEPLQDYGVQIKDVEQLTGLAEYRNGGLLIDYGVLQPRDPQVLRQPQEVGSPVVVAWRALTIVGLDLVAERIRERLGWSEVELPLVKVLQGGTWTAGREIAARKRPGGIPPLQVISDGTVF
ncbi:MAG: DUF1688 family protein [Thermostichales cyanobacterium SZTDM-1c_bins_54]